MTAHSTVVRSFLNKAVASLLFSLTFLLIGQAQSISSDDRVRAVALLQSGDAVGAAKLLRAITKRSKNDVVAWHWLALAFESQGKNADARKAHEKAAKLGDALLIAQVDASGLDNFVAVITELKPQLALAAESADSYLKLSPKLSKSKADEWNERAQFLHDYQDFPQVSGLTIYKGKEVTTKARILAKPEPSYTEAAREHQVTGTVVLRAIFAEDGKVRAILPLARLPYGLTAKAIRAAREIRFIPATKDGHPVSMWMQLEYNFNLY